MVINSTKLPWMRDDRVILSLTIGAHTGDDVRFSRLRLLSLTCKGNRSLDTPELVQKAFQEVPTNQYGVGSEVLRKQMGLIPRL